MPEDDHVKATTTTEEDRHTANQRRVNMLWEYTQSAIALAITVAEIYSALRGIQSPQLHNAFFLIVGFYFGRTNHARVGGIQMPYAGR